MSHFKRFLIFALSALLIFAQPVAYAASPNGWSASPADIIMNGATATINAVKGSGSSALQATIKHAPTAARVAKHIVKVGGVGAVAMAITQILGDGVDWVLDPANNSVTYKEGSLPKEHLPKLWVWNAAMSGNDGVTTADAACRKAAFSKAQAQAVNNYMYTIYKSVTITSVDGATCIYDAYNTFSGEYYGTTTHKINRKSNSAYDPKAEDTRPKKNLSFDAVAQKLISNAASGDPQSQEFVKTIAVEDVESGALDVPLNIAAVPKADNPPVTDPNNPPVTDPNNPPVPFDPSSIIAAIKSVMSAVVNMSGVLGAKIDGLMIDLGLQNDKTNKVINDSVDRVIANDNVNVGELVAAIEAIEGNTLTGEVINDAVDRAIAAGNADTASIVAAIEAIEGNTLDGQVINDAVDRVIANDNVNAQSAADAAEAAEAARSADALEAKEAADAKAAADAAALEWAKEAPEAPTDTGVMVDEPISDFDSDKSYITFTGSCPPKYTASLSIMGATAPFEFDYTPICTVMSYLKPFIVGAGYIAAAYIIAGHSRGSKD